MFNDITASKCLDILESYSSFPTEEIEPTHSFEELGFDDEELEDYIDDIREEFGVDIKDDEVTPENSFSDMIELVKKRLDE